MQTVPWDLPANKTMSGIKTHSSKGGARDGLKTARRRSTLSALKTRREKNSCGSMRVPVQLTEVEHDEDKWVGNDRRKVIDRDEFNTIHRDRTEIADRNEKINVHGWRTEEVTPDETLTVHKNRKRTVDLNESITIKVSRDKPSKAREKDKIGATDSST